MRCRGRGQGLKCDLSALFAQEKDGGYRKLLMRKTEMSYPDTERHYRVVSGDVCRVNLKKKK